MAKQVKYKLPDKEVVHGEVCSNCSQELVHPEVGRLNGEIIHFEWKRIEHKDVKSCIKHLVQMIEDSKNHSHTVY